MPTPSTLTTEWAQTLARSFADCGLREVVLSPGSRSTPLVLALARETRLRLHDIVDERAAGFFALAQAKCSGRPSLLLCTSGSAPAHYLPAVIEASQAYVPLIVLSADRPFYLQQCGASQTVDQRALFGVHVRFFAHLGLPQPPALRALRRQCVQAWHASHDPLPGPVHLNLELDKPFEPPLDEVGNERALPGDHALPTRIYAAQRVASTEGVEDLAEAITAAERPLLLCGPALPEQRRLRALLPDLCERGAILCAAEATSQLRFGVESLPHFGHLEWITHLPDFEERLRPDLIVQLGAAPTSGRWLDLLARPSAPPRYIIAARGWPDPSGNARAIVQGDAFLILKRLLEHFTAKPKPPSRWRADVREVDGQIDRRLAAFLAALPHLSEGAAVRQLLDALAAETCLMVGNSLAVRHLDLWAPPSAKTLTLLSQRGAAGIEGFVVGLCGAATQHPGPVVGLIGDVALRHDLSSLALLARQTRPCLLVVLHNQGGRIFEQLPMAGHPAFQPQLHHWTTPQSDSFAALAAAFGLAYACAESPGAYREGLREALNARAPFLLEARVPPSSAAGDFESFHRSLADLR